MEAAVLAVIASIAVGIVAVSRRRADAEIRHARAELTGAREELRRHERASEGLRETRDLILSSMHDGVLLLDPNGRTAYANAAFERLLGSVPGSTTGLFPLGLRELAERAREGTAGSLIVESGAPTRWIRCEAMPVGDDGSVLFVARDVTESRQLDAIRRDFVANASHELKTPAASIRATAETLGQAAVDDPEAVPRFAAQLERDAVRLSRIVADLLDLSRLESGSEMEADVRLDAIVREEAQRFEDVVAAAGVELVVDAPAAAVVRGSARDLSLLVRNLVDNAIRYTRPGGSVSARLALADASAVLLVRDTGVGIPQRDLTRIFERFYRVDRARSRDTGATGLGLAIVKHVAENHGGTVEVRSELGAGTEVEVTLPASAPASSGAT
ncbi:MAG TPA: ATP-binding protein [Actinomycetota bacterium]|nr:ATP-binding protein [Actinomycetota bacterium]